MSRLRQRLHHRFSDTTSPGNIRRREAIADINIDPANITSLANLNAAGLWQTDAGMTMCNQPFTAAMCRIDRSGYLVINQQAVGTMMFGEWYNNIPTDYPASVLASRILRSEMMIEYQMIGGMNDAAMLNSFAAYSPAAGMGAAPIIFAINFSAGVNLFSEPTIAPGGIGTAFVSERDLISNKVRISAQRVNANSKNFVCTWYDRTAGATASATVNWAGAGVGDTPLMWSIWFAAGGALPNSQLLVVKSLQISDSAITYGDFPV